jgi:uncharacterized C2H2 Zn-finger protein
MCTCASCSHTDGYAGKSFAEWPRGKPAGKSSERDYAAHVRYAQQWGKGHGKPECGKVARAAGTRREDPHAKYKWPRYAEDMTTADYVAVFLRDNNLAPEKEKAAGLVAARPATPCKAPQHFPAGDRTSEAATIYDMRKEKAKRSVGRPPLPGRRVIVKLEERQIKAAEKLGAGNIAAGIRKALQSA